MTTRRREDGHTFQKTTLDSGLRVISTEMQHTRSVSLNILVGVGSRHEATEQAGLSHFIEHLAFKGTERRPTPMEISGPIEGVGGSVNASTEHELTVFWCKVPGTHFSESLDLLIDMVRNSRCDPDDLEKERMVIFEELSMLDDYPNSRVEVLVDQMLWPDHPLGREVGGTKESVGTIDRQMVVDHLERYYTPGNIVVSVAGNISHEEVVDQVAALSQGWRSGATPEWTPFTGSQSEPKLRLEYRRTEQAHLSIALPGLSMTHPDRYALDLLNVMLGDGMSSRLFMEVRERQGLAYDIHSGVTHFEDCGALVITAGVDPKHVYEAVDTILVEVARMRQGVPEEELERAKNLSAGRLMMRMEDTRSVAGWQGIQEALLGEILEVDEVVGRMRKVTPADVRKVANDLFLTERLNLAVVGPCRGQRRLERSLALN